MSADEVAFHNLGCLVCIHLNVGDLRFARFHDLYDRLILAKTDASGLGNGNFIGQTFFLNECGKGVKDRSCAAGNALYFY